MADKPPLIGGTGDGESRSTAKDDLESASVSSTGSNIVDVTDTGNFTTSVNIETQQGTETPPDNTHTGHVKRTDGKERENSSVCSRHENISVGPQSRIDPHSSRETPSHSGVHQQTSSGDSLPPSYPRNIDPESAQNGNATAKSGDVHEHQVTTPLEKQNSNSEGQRFGVAKQNVTTIDAVSNIKLLQQTSDKSPPTELQDANKEDPHASAVGGTSTAEMMDNKPPDRVEICSESTLVTPMSAVEQSASSTLHKETCVDTPLEKHSTEGGTETSSERKDSAPVGSIKKGNEVVLQESPPKSTLPALTDQLTSSGSVRSPLRVVDTSGVIEPIQQGITVTFHILLPVDVWKYDEKRSKLSLCFGHKRLGYWQPIGSFQFLREARAGLKEFLCDLCIDGCILEKEKCIPYKYYLAGNALPYEFLYGVKCNSSEVVNRCLVVPTKDFRLGGRFHQFDSTMFPQEIGEETGRWNWLPGSSFIRGLTSGTNTVVAHDTVQQECLDIYLRNNWDVLLNLKVTDVYGSMINITSIFNQLETPKVHHHNQSHVWPTNKLPQAMKNWLLSALKELQKIPINGPSQNGQRMVSVLCILLCLDELIPRKITMKDVRTDDASLMMSMLTLQPNVKLRKCEDFQIVHGSIIAAVKKQVTDALLQFCNHLCHHASLSNPLWLYAVPLFHFLQGRCQPFDVLELDPDKIMWLDSSLGLHTVRQKTYHADHVRLIEQHCSILEPLLQADPLLLYLLMYICPRQQLMYLVQKIPLYISASWTCYLIKKKLSSTEKDVFLLITEVFNQRMEISNITETSLLKATTKAFLQLLKLLLNLENIPDLFKNALIPTLSLVLHATHTLKLKVKYRHASHAFNQELKSVCGQLHQWITRQFSPPFQIQSQHFHGRPKLQEFMTWDMLMKVECPQAAYPLWQELIKQAIKERVDAIIPVYKVTLFLLLGSYGKCHPDLEDVVITATIERLNKLKVAEQASHLETFHKYIEDKRIVAIIFSALLTIMYPCGINNLEPLEILNWPLWPLYLKIHSSLILDTCEEVNQLCICCSKALHIFTDMHCKIITGSLTIKQFRSVEEQKKQMARLCEATDTLRFAEIDSSLKTHISSYDTLMKRVQKLKYLFSHVLSYLNIEGIEDLHDKLDENHEDECINVLLSTSGDRVSLLQTMDTCHLPESMLDDCICIAETYANGFFDRVWHKVISEAGDTLSMSDIILKLWEPTITECHVLLSSLRQRTMTLATVDDVFQPYHNKRNSAIKDMVNLFKGLRSCDNNLGDIAQAEEEITRAVDVVEEYWSLCTYAHAARVCLQLKDTLQLKGNFDAVKVLASQDTESMKHQSLGDIDNTLISTGRFLQEFASEEKLSCLETYCRCSNIVAWLKMNTKDVTGLQNFVTVALNNAATGEDTLTNDKLSSLRAVGSGFGYLIYELTTDADFDALKKGCHFVWEALQHTPCLPQYLEDCNNELEWFKDIKAQEGSVKETSFGQMDSCIMYGEYRVGEGRSTPFSEVSEAIVLTIEADHKRKYTLDQLKDLESKLVLITGSRDGRREKVEGFLNMFHTVCEIAEVLIALQQVGNVKYLGWYVTVPCKYELLLELRTLHNNMLCELYSWKEEVRKARHYHCELNYFTTPQLLTLRKELGCLKSSPSTSHTVSSQVRTLLQSIVPDIAIKTIIESMQSEVDEGEHTSSITEHEQKTQEPPEVNVEKESDSAEIGEVDQTSLEHLTPTQGETFDYLIGIYGNCYKKWILKAFENGEEDRVEIVNFVTENLKSSEDDSSEAWSSEDDISEGWSSEDEARPVTSLTQQRLQPFKEVAMSPTNGSERGDDLSQVTTKEAVDESHLAVQALIQAGFGEAESISAIEKFGSPESAIDYLVTQKAEPSRLSKSKDVESTEIYETLQAPALCCYRKAVKNYLTLTELGNILRRLSMRPAASKLRGSFDSRTFDLKLLKTGSPNLLVVPKDQVLRTAISLYMADCDVQKGLPLPSFEEILICNSCTTSEQVELLWQRAVQDPVHRLIFCLVHAETLTYQTCDNALKSLHEIIEGKQDYRIVIICSSEKEDQSLMIAKLSQYRRPYLPPEDVAMYQTYLKTHFHNPLQEIDGLRSTVRVILSTRAGMGKTLCIKNMTQTLNESSHQTSTIRITIPIHGPTFSVASLIKSLAECMDNQKYVVHLDIAPNVMWQLDTVIFSMFIQGGLCDQQGNIWRINHNHFYAIEVTLTAKETKLLEKNAMFLALITLLPTVECASPQECKTLLKHENEPGKCLFDEATFKSPPFQRVYQYLRRHEEGESLDSFLFNNGVEGNTYECLAVLLRHCGVQDPSWAEINHFVNFLNIQLNLCEKSVFCNEDFVGDVLRGFKTFVVKFMIRMSRDFATSSLQREGDEDSKSLGQEKALIQYQILERKRWERNAHPYIFFNDDDCGITLTFVGFMVSKNGDLIDANQKIIEKAIMTSQLKESLRPQGIDFEDNYKTWDKRKMIAKIGAVMGLRHVDDCDPSYVLTIDNLIKILAIQMRFRCNIPVVLMGETGCGKTRLIRFMCDLASQTSEMRNMLILKVHGGTTERDIVEFVSTAEKQAKLNRVQGVKQTVVFFDEANATDAIGLIKEVMCDHCLYGKPVTEELKFIAACNPYKRHSDDMIEKLENAGLGFYVHAEQTKERLGKIPLRNLVYRVQDLPPSMRPFVYDFGQLKEDQEESYINCIVTNSIHNSSGFSASLQGTVSVITKVLCWSQKYMRERKDECSYVSLRDVERAMLVFEYFYQKMDLLSSLMDTRSKPKYKSDEVKFLTRSLILSLSICYQARLKSREDYEKGVAQKFSPPLELAGKAEQFRQEIQRCQDVLLDSMELGKNIARNSALKENVFMMAVCVDLRIPLFLVGKPGSSKSLAKSIIANSMNGKSSKNKLLKSFKEVHMFSYQCSQLSTSGSIIKVFETAKSFQKEDTSTYVSVVVLDEVGLAEDSPNLPLKALHPLLEDGTAGADITSESAQEQFTDEIIERDKRVAFIGISNWALDPAKMNRGVMVTRGDPDVKELELSARGICSTKEKDNVRDLLEKYFRPLAEAYDAICKKQQWQFFGLRDFYSLIKMLYWMCKTTGLKPTGAQLRHAIMRNFGGMQEFSAYDEFRKRLPGNVSQVEISAKVDFSHPDCSSHGLIRASLETRDTTWHGTIRINYYLGQAIVWCSPAVYTADIAGCAVGLKERLGEPIFAVFDRKLCSVLKHFIHDLHPIEETKSFQTRESIHTPFITSSTELDPWELEPFVLFGSSFPRDTEYTQVCRNINQIKICMETGRMVVLLNLHNLYESLYDLLNQYYIHYGEERYVDLGLQTHRLKCKVHKQFKLIMIAEKATVYEKFPTPLINRLEKHFVLMSSILSAQEKDILSRLDSWITQFSKVKSSTFQRKDAFVGYRDDTPAAVVFQANHLLHKLIQGKKKKSLEWIRFDDAAVFDAEILSGITSSHEKMHSEKWISAVLQLCKYILLYTCSPAALVRLAETPLLADFSHLCYMYKKQHHSSISDFLKYHIELCWNTQSMDGLLMQPYASRTAAHSLQLSDVSKNTKKDLQAFCSTSRIYSHNEWSRSFVMRFLCDEMSEEITTHSHLLSTNEVDRVEKILEYENGSIASFLLHDFDTELHFSSKVGPLFKSNRGKYCRLIIVQCDMGCVTDNLIACARHRIYDMRASVKREMKDNEVVIGTHVLFIIHLPVQTVQSSLVGFQGDPWISAHIDEIRPTLEGNLTLDIAQGVPISQVFYGPFDDPTLVQTVDEQQLQSRAKEEVTFSSTTQKLAFESGPTHQEISSVTCPYEQIVTHEPNITAPEACPMKQILHETSDQVCSQEHGPTKQIIALVAGPVTQALPNSSTQAVNIVQRRFVPPLYTQCRRLHICIQAAASKLIQFTPNKRWATQRIEILIRLIPDEPAFPLDTTSFYGIIVKYIHILLKERDDTYHLASNWVLEEAMNTRKLHIGGTFKNALAKKIDNIIIPLFAEVIATIDRNQNLYHLKDLGKKLCTIHDLWLHIFSTPEVFNLSYVEIAGRKKAPVKDDFRCTFPFSWLIREAVDNQLESVKGYSGPLEDKYQQLCFTFSETLIGRLLNDFEVVNEETGEYLVQNYVVDFLHMSYKGVHFHSSEKEMECKLLQKVVFNLSKKSALLSAHVAWNNGQALSQRIVAVHIVYHSIEEEIHWFGQLTLCMPGVLQHLDTVTLESTEMELHLQALQRVLEILKPQPVKTEAVVKQWLTHVTRCHNAIDSILVVSPDHFLARQARRDWQRIQVLQMFVQHVVLKYDGMRQYANRLQLHMKKGADFSKLETMKRLRVFLKAVNNELRDLYKTKESKKIYHAIMKSCDDFFMEVVSTLCFGQATVPDGDLIEMLLNLIFTAATSADGATTSTKQLTSHKQRTDEVPVIRSFLLQLLLGQNSELLQEYLQMFFDKSVQALGYEHNRDLLLMCSQCYEDGLVKRYSSVTWEDQLLPCITFLNSGLHKLRTGENELSLKYLEMIASLRYALGVVAEILHRHCFIAQQMPQEDSSNGESQYDKDVSEECLSAVPTIVSPQTDANAKESDMDCKVDLDDTKVAPITEREAVVQLLHTAKSICTISSTSGPLLYLLKQIVRRFGFTLFRKIVKFHPWLVPKTLFWAGEVSNTLDEFVIYGEEYIDIRESTNALAMSGQLHQLPLTQNEEQCSALLLLSLFRLVRKKQKLDHKSLTSVIQKSKGLTEEMKTMAKQILNEQEGPLVSIVKTHPFLAQNVSSLSVIIHSVAALLCRQKVDMLLPFKTMLYHPTSLAKCYLPTMPDGISQENIFAIAESGQLYECTNGHPIFVNECQKRVRATCSDCNAPMKLGSEKVILKDDTAYQGHCLSSPETRNCIPSGVRCLTPAACAIIQAIMHSTLLWAAVSRKTNIQDIIKTEDLLTSDIPGFFCLHVIKDIQILAKAICRNEDEAAIVIHLVLKQILTNEPLTSGVMKTIASLTNPRQRDEWEMIFNKMYIQPVLTNLEKNIQAGMKSMFEDSNTEHDPLLYMVYNESILSEDSEDAYLWSYRSRISLEHLAIELQPQQKQHPILTTFIEQEAVLRATPYLADIVKLQNALYNEFHHRIGLKVAKEKTIGEFISEKHLPKSLLYSFAKAWSLVNHKLGDHGRIKVGQKLLGELPQVSEETTLQYLIPTTTGPGVCSFALVDYLVVQHNSFIEMCQGVMVEQGKSESIQIWKAHRIRLSLIHHCHLIDYEQQLISVVLSHCHYSLQVGHGQDVTYDLPALEKHIFDRFIQGKPKIIPEMIDVSYTKGTYMAISFFAIRMKVQHQVELPMKLQKEIVSELLEIDQTAEALDVVNIVLRFLSSGGGKATTSLGHYLSQLKMGGKWEERNINKMAEHCALGHIISLWKVLSVDLGKKMMKRGQEPFEVDTRFQGELTVDDKNVMDVYLSGFSSHDYLLGVMCEFIEYVEHYLKYTIPLQQEWTLQETLMAFLEQNQQEVPDGHDFPDSILLSQTLATWKHIVAFQEARQV